MDKHTQGEDFDDGRPDDDRPTPREVWRARIEREDREERKAGWRRIWAAVSVGLVVAAVSNAANILVEGIRSWWHLHVR
jgi:hypothetical protein